jgi:hypothetical protein
MVVDVDYSIVLASQSPQKRNLWWHPNVLELAPMTRRYPCNRGAEALIMVVAL